MSLLPPNTSFRVAPEFQPLLRRLGLSADGVFADPRVVAWRTLDDRENCTLDARDADGAPVRLHVKRYQPTRGFTTPADDEVKGHRSLAFERIPTAPLVGWGRLPDGRSFTIWQDLAGYAPADRLIGSGGMTFDQLLVPTADLSARLHARGLHHRDLYLCHFMVRDDAGVGDVRGDAGGVDVRLIDTARVRRLGGLLTRRRWIIKDLAQLWYSTTKLPVTDEQRLAWLERYANQRGDGTTTAAGLRGAIERKVRAIAAHDRNLNAAQPNRNISIPGAGARPPAVQSSRTAADVSSPAPANAAFRVRKATPDDAEALLAHAVCIAGEPGVAVTLAPGELNLTVEQERQFVAETNASDNSVFLVAEADRQIVGILTCVGGKRRALRHVTTLGVSVRREWRGRGVGTALMRAAIDWAKSTGVVTRIELHAFARNRAAIGLYERLGFVTEGRCRRAVFRDGEYQDDVIMALLL
jgi:RimJ/RimL family protein N-acetyltransferase